MKYIIGILTAIISSGIIIWSVENQYSFAQIVTGFFCFITPIIFLSAFKSNASMYVLISSLVLFSYLSYKLGYYNTYVGVLLATIIGLPIHYFVVRNTKIE
jgi:hypothetical protein